MLSPDFGHLSLLAIYSLLMVAFLMEFDDSAQCFTGICL
jgi:hypothetical protein